MKEFWELLKRHGLNPTPISSEKTRIPQFHDVDNGVSYLEADTAERLIAWWLRDQGRPLKYAYYVRDLDEGENGLHAGTYCNTNIYPKEWQQSHLLRSAYGSIYTTSLAEHGFIRRGESAIFSPSAYLLGEEGYTLLQARIITLPKS